MLGIRVRVEDLRWVSTWVTCSLAAREREVGARVRAGSAGANPMRLSVRLLAYAGLWCNAGPDSLVG